MVHDEKRLFFLDHLKTFIIFLVVVYHAGWVYEKSGMMSSVWIVDDPSKSGLPGILGLITDMFMMPVLFFISGYFTPLSLKRKTGWGFIKSRLKRLMVPWLLAVLFLLPMYKVIFLYSRNLPQENLASYLYFSGGILINQGWLWFLPVLFLFDVLYLVLMTVNPVKIKFSFKGAVLTVFVIGFLYSFGMSFFKLTGWTKTILLDFQNQRLLIYFMVFLLGSLCYKLNMFARKDTSRTLYYIICSTVWIPMNIYIIFLINLFLNPGHYIISYMVDVALAWLGFHLSLLGLMYVIINTFRYYLNRNGNVITRLNRSAYGVYIIHFIVMGGIAFLLLNIRIPSIVKYAVLSLSTYAVSHLIVHYYQKGRRLIYSRN